MSGSDKEIAIVLCTYRIQSSRENDFLQLLQKHWPKLRELDLVTEKKPVMYRGEDGPEQPFFIEIFEWKPGGFEIAHNHPEVLAIWEPMGAMGESRGPDKPAMSFPHMQPLELELASA